MEGSELDRQALILKAIGRLVDGAFEDAGYEIKRIKRQSSATSRLTSGTSVVEIGNACASAFQKACIEALEKVQFEDREGALELAEIVRVKNLSPTRPKFVDLYLEETVGPQPKFGTPDMRVSERFMLRPQMEQRLLRLEANAVEEFQLAVTRQSPRARLQVHTSTYVHPDRLEELKAKTSILWDFSRLIALCEELNTAWQYGAHHSVAMLMRAILDHVPPVLDQKGFSGVADNYAGSKSFKEAMANLDKLLRKIGDGHLHTQIRDREVLPNANQVDFRAGLDLLLSEIVRVTP